jgi:hypothetical protein
MRVLHCRPLLHDRGRSARTIFASSRSFQLLGGDSIDGSGIDARPLPAALDDRGGQQCLFRRQRRERLWVSYVYFESEPERRAAGNLMTKDEARRIAAGIAKLPELLKGRHDGMDTDEAGGATPGFPA